MDKNYGQIFIIWDKLFGTYQEELADVPAVYGITRPVRTWNPIKINFMHLWLLIKDAWHAQHWKDKLRIWFMPTGWRPDDVAAKFPVYKIEDVYHFEKYDTGHTKTMVIWSWVQLAITLLFISYLFGNIAAIGSPNMFVYGAFVFLQVYAFTELMDRSKYAWIWETLKTIFGLLLLIQNNDWFGLSQYTSLAVPVLSAYFVLSLMVCLYFVLKENIEIRNIK